MRILEALKILEDTVEVREALALLAPHCRPEWLITGFRSRLKPHEEFGPGGEGQQQNLRVNFSGIHTNVRELLARQIRRLDNSYRKTKDPAAQSRALNIAGAVVVAR